MICCRHLDLCWGASSFTHHQCRMSALWKRPPPHTKSVIITMVLTSSLETSDRVSKRDPWLHFENHWFVILAGAKDDRMVRSPISIKCWCSFENRGHQCSLHQSWPSSLLWQWSKWSPIYIKSGASSSPCSIKPNPIFLCYFSFSVIVLFLWHWFVYTGSFLPTYKHSLLLPIWKGEKKKKPRRKENCTFSPVSLQSKYLIPETLVSSF